MLPRRRRRRGGIEVGIGLTSPLGGLAGSIGAAGIRPALRLGGMTAVELEAEMLILCRGSEQMKNHTPSTSEEKTEEQNEKAC